MKDEQKETDKFVKLCGSVKKAEQLFRLYTNSFPFGTSLTFLMDRGKTKEQVFIKKALEENFTMKQINALLNLQKG